jgi:cytochrome c biogenesis factor
MLKTWNLGLIILAFALTIFGTFLTRSGILSSIHAFSGGAVGAFFLGFLGLVLSSTGGTGCGTSPSWMPSSRARAPSCSTTWCWGPPPSRSSSGPSFPWWPRRCGG